MSTDLKLQRLAYPFREKGIQQAEFGPSVSKFGAITSFFTCATMIHSNFADGKIQVVLDNLFANRKTVVGHSIDVRFQFTEASADNPNHPAVRHTRPFFVLGQKDRLREFEANMNRASAAYKEDSPLLISGLREFMLADFLSQADPETQDTQYDKLAQNISPNLLTNTMGWLDLNSGCFAMRSMNSLNRIRELFGMRPHMAMMKQRGNYPQIDFE